MTRSMSFIVETDLGEISLVCDEALAPRTLEALRRSVPMESQLHTPKIAGSHVYWHAPFVCDLEGTRDVMDMPAGAFFYWPERQFLEISFAPLQAETASVTPLGCADCPIEKLVALGERVRIMQGRAINTIRLKPVGKSMMQPDLSSPLHEVRRMIWAAMPEEIAELPRRRGIMHPVGPLFFAEGETRNLHEFLWWARKAAAAEGHEFPRRAAAMAADKAAARLRGFCHLPDSATALDAVALALRDMNQPALPVFEDSILIVGKLSAWLDLVIRWNDLNEAMVADG